VLLAKSTFFKSFVLLNQLCIFLLFLFQTLTWEFKGKTVLLHLLLQLSIFVKLLVQLQFHPCRFFTKFHLVNF
jgi:hypothetical protein